VTEREFFNANLKCGDLPLSLRSENYVAISGKGCGSRDWRVIKPNLFAYNERRLICRGCSYDTLVMMPDMTVPAAQPAQKQGEPK
jgi:hypothetical protein